MKYNFDEMETGGGPTFQEKKRYALVVNNIKEGFSKDKGTPYMKIILATPEGESAWDKTLWMTPKALYRAQEWFAAMGLPTAGEVDVVPENLSGIRLTAECAYRKYSDNGVEKKAVEWVAPQKVAIGNAPAPAAAQAQKAPATAPASSMIDEVPF